MRNWLERCSFESDVFEVLCLTAKMGDIDSTSFVLKTRDISPR